MSEKFRNIPGWHCSRAVCDWQTDKDEPPRTRRGPCPKCGCVEIVKNWTIDRPPAPADPNPRSSETPGQAYMRGQHDFRLRVVEVLHEDERDRAAAALIAKFPIHGYISPDEIAERALAASMEATKNLRARELDAERIPSGLMEMRLTQTVKPSEAPADPWKDVERIPGGLHTVDRGGYTVVSGFWMRAADVDAARLAIQQEIAALRAQVEALAREIEDRKVATARDVKHMNWQRDRMATE